MFVRFRLRRVPRGLLVCRVHAGGHPVTARVTTSQGPAEKFFIRLDNATRSIDEESEVEKYIAQR